MFPKKPPPTLNKDVKYDAIGDEENDDNVELSSMNKARTSLISPRNRKSGTRICLNDIPKDLAAKLRHLDLEDDGYIDVEDIMVLDQKEQIEEDTVIYYRRMFLVLIVVWLLQIAAVFAVSIAAINSTKDSFVVRNQLSTKSGDVVQTAIADLCVLPHGILSLRNVDGTCPATSFESSPAIATSRSTIELELSSDLPDSTLKEIISIYAMSPMNPTCTTVYLTVNGFFHPDPEHLILLTNIGTLQLEGTTLSFTDTTQEAYFAKAGFQVVPHNNRANEASRRLLTSSITATVNNKNPSHTAVNPPPPVNPKPAPAPPPVAPKPGPIPVPPTIKPVAVAVSTVKPVVVIPPVTTGKPTTIAPVISLTTSRPTIGPTIIPSIGAFCKKSNGISVSNATNTCTAYKSILKDFTAAIPTSAFEQANLFGQAIRLAFHDAGEADIRTSDSLGPDGCLSNSGDNAGLIESTSLVFTVLEPIWQNYCDKITRADFWTLAAILAIQAAEPTKTISLPFQYGRKDNLNCNAGGGRLPSAQLGIPHLNTVFGSQMGLTLTDAVTLLGAHTIGHVHTANSGYGNPGVLSANNLLNAWDNTPNVFDNQYYTSILTPWASSTSSNAPTKSLWVRPDTNIMLNADICLGCNITINSTTKLGVTGQRCPGGGGSATLPTTLGSPSTLRLVQSYARNNALFLSEFGTSFTRMTTVGYSGTSSKLGSVVPIDLTKC